MRSLFVVLRLVFAAAAILAVLFQGFSFVYASAQLGVTGCFVRGAFLSYFTIDSNLLWIATLLIGAVLLMLGAQELPWYRTLRAAALVTIVTTGVVYNVFLRTGPPGLDPGSVANEMVHTVGPAFAVADWLLAPSRPALRWRVFPVLMAFPLVWLVVTFARGPSALDPATGSPGWYVYAFLIPGPATVPAVAKILAIVAALAAAAIATSRRRLPAP